MGIQAHIDRIINAKNSIIAKIKVRGVSIPVDSSIDDIPAYIDQIPKGIDTSDATAVANDIEKNKTAYVNGVKVTGNITIEGNKDTISGLGGILGNFLFRSAGTNQVSFEAESTASKKIVNPNCKFNYFFDGSKFGTATASDVLRGKTFTAIPGANVKGTCDYDANTSDANATANDIESGRTAYVNGKKITGTIRAVGKIGDLSQAYKIPNIIKTEFSDSSTGSETITLLRIIMDSNNKTILNNNSKVYVNVPRSLLGTATAADVRSGKTFSGADGACKTGTYIPPSGGLDTSDATATANDIAKGKTAYVNGQKITGAISAGSITYGSANAKESRYEDGQLSYISFKVIPSSDHIIRKNNSVEIMLQDIAQLGNATAADVKSGKTFTSTAGLKVTGTYTPPSSSSNNCEAYEINTSNLNVKFKKTSGTIKLYGYATGPQSGWQKPSYVFEGTTYRNASIIAGGGTSQNLNITISSSGAITLPVQLEANQKLLIMR